MARKVIVNINKISNEYAMKKQSISILLITFFFVATLFIQNASAIGKWRSGIVDESPWHDAYTYVVIDETKYVIMPEVKTVRVHKQNGVENRKMTSVASIREGDRLVFMVEGNRIYQIQIMN